MSDYFYHYITTQEAPSGAVGFIVTGGMGAVCPHQIIYRELDLPIQTKKKVTLSIPEKLKEKNEEFQNISVRDNTRSEDFDDCLFALFGNLFRDKVLDNDPGNCRYQSG